MPRRIAFGSTLIGLVFVGGLLYQALRPKPRRVALPKHPLRFYDVPKPRVFSHDEFWKLVRARLGAKHAAKIVNPLESNADIRAWAQSVTWGQPDDLHKAKALYDAVSKLPHGKLAGCSTAQEVFYRRTALHPMFDCDELTHLYVATARDVGLQTFFTDVPPNHACAAIWIGDKTLLVDPQENKFGAKVEKFRVLNDVETAAFHLITSNLLDYFKRDDPHFREKIDARHLAVRLCPQWTRLRLTLIESLRWGSRDLVGMEREARTVLKAEPSNADAMGYLADALALQNKRRESIYAYQAAVRLDPNRWGFHLNLAGRWFLIGETDKAIAEARAVLKLKPNSSSDYKLGQLLACQSLARFLEAKRRYDEALKMYEKAMVFDPDDSILRYELGRCLLSRKRYAEAEKHFREVQRLIIARKSLPFIDAWFFLGMALYGQHKDEEAQAQLEAYVKDGDGSYVQRANQVLADIKRRQSLTRR